MNNNEIKNNTKQTISFTQISTYITCPLRYKFRNIDKIEPEERPAGKAFGDTIHRVLKTFNSKLKEGRLLSIDEITKIFNLHWEAATTVPIKWNGEDKTKLKEKGIEILKLYTRNYNTKIKPKEVELSFVIPLVYPNTDRILQVEDKDNLKEIYLSGYIDLITENKEIVEIKTTSYTWNKEKCDNDLQMTVYSYAYRQLYKEKENSLRFDILTKGKYSKYEQIKTERSKEDYIKLIKLIEQVIKAIDHNIYYPIYSFYCSGCEYKSPYCKEWRGV